VKETIRKLIAEEVSTLFEAKTELEKAQQSAEEYSKRYLKLAEEHYMARQFYWTVRRIIMNPSPGDNDAETIEKMRMLLDEANEKYHLP